MILTSRIFGVPLDVFGQVSNVTVIVVEGRALLFAVYRKRSIKILNCLSQQRLERTKTGFVNNGVYSKRK